MALGVSPSFSHSAFTWFGPGFSRSAFALADSCRGAAGFGRLTFASCCVDPSILEPSLGSLVEIDSARKVEGDGVVNETDDAIEGDGAAVEMERTAPLPSRNIGDEVVILEVLIPAEKNNENLCIADSFWSVKGFWSLLSDKDACPPLDKHSKARKVRYMVDGWEWLV